MSNGSEDMSMRRRQKRQLRMTQHLGLGVSAEYAHALYK